MFKLFLLKLFILFCFVIISEFLSERKSFESLRQEKYVLFFLHHGNGTQEIFLGDEKVTFISLQVLSFYPETGFKSEKIT